MWYEIIPACMFVIAIVMLSFGVWGIICWDQYSKLLSNIKEFIEKIHI